MAATSGLASTARALPLDRAALVAQVQLIMNGPVGPTATEAEEDALVTLFERSVSHPEVSDLIFWPERAGLGPDPTAEEIVEAALAYRPLITSLPGDE